MKRSLETPVLRLSGAEVQERFERLQARLPTLWRRSGALGQSDHTVVVVPSLTVDYELQGSLAQAYEERFLFMLLLLREPRARVVYLTSQPVAPNVVDYYLGLLSGVIPSHARQRLFLLAPGDSGPLPLTAKLLQRPLLLERIRALITDPMSAHLAPFITTELERDLALRLGIPIYGTDPRHAHFGTKTGSRRVFRELGVPHPRGLEGVHTRDDVVDAVASLLEQNPEIDAFLVKHDTGVSGDGNALLDARGLGSRPSRQAIAHRLRRLELASNRWSLETYLDKLDQTGGIVEERVRAESIESPSVQLRVDPLGQLEVLSTHDQLLGGRSGQIFQGCLFPARPEYALLITEHAVVVGKRLAAEGVRGRFALDFLVTPTPSGWSAQAIELNLRLGGTTHPFLTLQFLTEGRYDATRGGFTSARGLDKHFVASDAVCALEYRALRPADLFELTLENGIHYDHARETGVVFHMMTALGDHGRTGLTAVESSRADALRLFETAVAVLEEGGREALRERELPEID